ncbi:MAG: outer membrane protein assembly factor BamA [Caldithrix sp.]|nr:outer membrane protein assembly factor BamA [Caldithrix sp.]
MSLSKKNIFIFLVLFAAFSLLSAQEDYVLNDIDFRGNETFSEDVLLEQVAMHGSGLFSKYIMGDEPFNFSEQILESDLERVVRFYQKEGFLYARAEKGEIKLDNADEEIDLLTIDITEGEAIRIAEVSFAFKMHSASKNLMQDSLIQETHDKMILQTGKRFRDQALQQDRQTMVEHFNDRGYAYTHARYDLSLDEQTGTIDITWEIDPGPRCFFGSITIAGNEHVSDELIYEQLKFKKGELFQSGILDESQQQIYSLGLFQIATVKAILGEKDKKTIPVKIQVKEAPRLTTRFGVGYGSEDKFRAFTSLQRLGFLGGARRIELLLKHSGLEPYNINLKWIQPQFLTRHTSITLNPFFRRETEPGFSARRLGLNIPLNHQFSGYLKGSIAYYLENMRQDFNSADPEFSKRSREDFNYAKSGLLLGIILDTSRPMFSPQQGLFGSANFKINGLPFPGDFNYTRLLVDLRRYQKLYGLVLALRCKFGVINSYDDDGFVPVEDRFYSGGSMSVRGWSRSTLGPLRKNSDPIGGKSLAEGFIELRYPIMGIVTGTFFLDSGNVWQPSYHHKLQDLRYAAGFGIRVNTPIGPVRLDFGWPIYDREKAGQIHINVGEAF